MLLMAFSFTTKTERQAKIVVFGYFFTWRKESQSAGESESEDEILKAL